MSEEKTTTSSSWESAAPWGAQQQYLRDAFAEAQNLYNQHGGNTYKGNHIAGFNPQQLQTFRDMIAFGRNSDIPGQTAAAGGQLFGSGMGALSGSLSGLQGFKPEGGVDSNIAAAGQYADNPYMSGMVDAAMRDSVRNATEAVLPQIARNAAAGGNLNSNRTAMQEAIVQRGLAEQAGDISANLRGQAYGQGLNLAQRGSEFNNTAILDALKSSGALGQGAANSGLGAWGQSLDQQSNLFNLMALGGSGLRDAKQAELSNALAKSEYAGNRPFDMLAKMFGIIGNPGYGYQKEGGGTSTTETTASPLSMAGAGLSIFGKIFSDRRVKTDITPVGKLDNGLTVYAFRYYDEADSPVVIGLMADEVEELHPDAVREFAGLKTVDYKLAVQ